MPATRKAPPAKAAPINAPRPATPWPEQGGILSTLMPGGEGKPDYYLILANTTPPNRLDWKKANAWATKLKIGAHKDFTLPTLAEQALLYATLKASFGPAFYWSSEPYAGTPDYAWGRYFNNVYAHYYRKSNEFRVAAVRRVFI